MTGRNIITSTVYSDEPPGWHRAEWVTVKHGLQAIRYETDYDLTCLLHNLAIAGALDRAFRLGRSACSCDGPWVESDAGCVHPGAWVSNVHNRTAP